MIKFKKTLALTILVVPIGFMLSFFLLRTNVFMQVLNIGIVGKTYVFGTALVGFVSFIAIPTLNQGNGFYVGNLIIQFTLGALSAFNGIRIFLGMSQYGRYTDTVGFIFLIGAFYGFSCGLMSGVVLINRGVQKAKRAVFGQHAETVDTAMDILDNFN